MTFAVRSSALTLARHVPVDALAVRGLAGWEGVL